MELKWINPFSKKTETIYLSDELIKPDGSIRIPTSFYSNNIWDAAFNGLIDAYEQGNVEYKKYLAYMILNILDSHDELVIRQVSPYIMGLPRLNEGLKNTPITNTEDAKNFIKHSHLTSFQELWNEAVLLIFGKKKPTKSLSIGSSQADIFYSGIIKAYNETHVGDINLKRHPRRFRDRYNRLTVKLNFSKEEIQLIKFESYICCSEFYHDIATAFLSATSTQYNNFEKEIFRLLHFKIPSNDEASVIKFLPSITSLTSFPPIQEIYKIVFKRLLLVDTYRFVKNFDSKDVKEEEWRQKFLNYILGTMRWYRTEYLDLAHKDDQSRLKLESLNQDTSYCEENDLSWESGGEDAFVELMDQRMGFSRQNNPMISEDRDKSISWEQWEEKIRKLGWTIKSFRSEADKKCTKKQKEALFILLDERLTPNEIAIRLGKKRQTVQGLLSDAFLKIGSPT